LSAGLSAPSDARRAAGELLAAHVTAEQLADTALMLSEVVTNALRHPVVRANGSIDLHMAVSSERIRAEIRDAGAGFPARRPVLVGADAVGGRGLLIVDRLASRWGTSTRQGHTVWFELDR
jgi:anti-sigma regulatory factor (Ser/Thr protein kinase)